MRLIICLLLLYSCSTLDNIGSTLSSDPTKFDPTKEYRYDMILTANGTAFEGMGVIPYAEQYDMQVEARGDLDLFVMQTCARHWVKESSWNVTSKVKSYVGWDRKLNDKRKTSFSYRQTDLERELAECPMRLEGWDKFKGKHSFALFDFADSKDTLSAYTSCNGETRKDSGIGWCELKVGIPQALTFEVETSSYSECPIEGWVPMDNGNTKVYKFVGKRLEFKTLKGLCVIYSKSKELQKSHRQTVHGYEVDPIREN